ncbi:MAG: glycyl-tRNA synthetase beta chain, partial [Bradymonadia bacterium]
MKLLFEIGTEELPAGEIAGALRALEQHIQKRAKVERLTIGAVRTMATPRRLTLLVDGIEASAKTVEERAMGPSTKI